MKNSEPHAPQASGSHGHGEHAGHHVNYVKIYWILLALLVVSVAGPFLGIQVVTLITAFGIAVVKAYLVAANFMHLKVEKRYVVYLMVTVVALMLLFYAGVAPDVMQHRGRGWENVAAQNWSKEAVKRAEAAEAAKRTGHGGEAHGQQPAGQQTH